MTNTCAAADFAMSSRTTRRNVRYSDGVREPRIQGPGARGTQNLGVSGQVPNRCSTCKCRDLQNSSKRQFCDSSHVFTRSNQRFSAVLRLMWPTVFLA